MAAPNAQAQVSTPGASNSLILSKRSQPGVVTPQGLERPVSSLAENVQRVMSSFYDVHKALQVKKAPKAVIDPFKDAKHLFRTECETLRQVLQSGYRHAVDFTASCQRAPNDRQISAKRCQLSGKNVLRDIQDVARVYETNLDRFQTQENSLKAHLAPKSRKPNGRRGSSADDIQVANGQIAEPNPEILVMTLLDALSSVRSSLRDLLAFWEEHAIFLTQVVNRQSNFPLPGEETKAMVELWTRYQAALLHASSSISQSADAMTVDPAVITAANMKAVRRHTLPVTKDSNRRPSNGHTGDDRSGPNTDTVNKPANEKPAVGLFKRLWTRLFQARGR